MYPAQSCFFSLLPCHTWNLPENSLTNILACKTSGFLLPGNPTCRNLSITLRCSICLPLWCHISRASLLPSLLQPHGPSFDASGSSHLLFPLCVKPSPPTHQDQLKQHEFKDAFPWLPPPVQINMKSPYVQSLSPHFASPLWCVDQLGWFEQSS